MLHFLGPHFAYQLLLAILKNNECLWPSDLDCLLSDTVCCFTPHFARRAVMLTPHSGFLNNSGFCFTLKFTEDFFSYFLDSILTNLETEKDILPRKLTLLKHILVLHLVAVKTKNELASCRTASYILH